MASKDDIKRYRMNWQAEKEAVFLYTRLSETESNDKIKEVYLKLAETEGRHVAVWEKKLVENGEPKPVFKAGLKPRILGFLSRHLGSSTVVPLIAAIEKNAASEYQGQTDIEAASMGDEEKSHARVFSFLAQHSSGLEGSEVSRFEGRHKTGGNALRAGVLGANDGLVSVFCLVMGVAGAGVAQREILITGAAGLLAGALSMSLGEWLSVQSSRELYTNQIRIEAQELEDAPEEEKEELILIYQAKGLDSESAAKMVEHIFRDKATALDTLAREELSIDPKELGGSAWEAAITSFFLFCLGALFPVVPYFFFTGIQGIAASAVISAIGLFILGILSSVMTGVNWLKSGFRQILFGLLAAAVTFGIGKLIGANL